MRYRSYGWDVYDIDGYDFEKMNQVFTEIRDHQKRPCLVMMHTIIGKGSPNKAGTHKVHGSPLGQEEVEATKKALGIPEENFFVAPGIYEFFRKKLKKAQNSKMHGTKHLKNGAQPIRSWLKNFTRCLIMNFLPIWSKNLLLLK